MATRKQKDSDAPDATNAPAVGEAVDEVVAAAPVKKARKSSAKKPAAEPAEAADEGAGDEAPAASDVEAAKPKKKAAAKKKPAVSGSVQQGLHEGLQDDLHEGEQHDAPGATHADAASAVHEVEGADETAAPAAARIVREPEPPAVAPDFPSTAYAVVEKLLTGFVGSEVRKVGVSRAVLGLSGGIDSAVSAAVAVRALGASNVLGVFMPYSSSSPESEADARAVASALGIELLVVDITPQVDAYFARFPDASRLRRGNKMARERMTILYDHSAARSALVIGTSNKTELLLGYGTLYGDMASALNPIGDLYKTQIWGFATHLGLPASVIDKAPTADLWSGQTDEHELGFSYHEVDRLLYRMIDERCSNDELVAMGFDAAFVERVSRMVRSSQFKRRLPIIAKLSARSIDTDFRYSRDWGL